MTKLTLKKRIELCRQVILSVREKFPHKPSKGVPKEWAYGCVGVLDFIETGDVSKILSSEIRTRIEKIIRRLGYE